MVSISSHVCLLRGHSFMVELTWKYMGLAWLSTVSSVMAFTCYLTLVGRMADVQAILVIFPVVALFISQRTESYQDAVFIIGLILVVPEIPLWPDRPQSRYLNEAIKLIPAIMVNP